MRVMPALCVPMSLAALLSLSPPKAVAQTMPFCAATLSSTFCFYAADPGDCIIENGQKYCHTIAFYVWERF